MAQELITISPIDGSVAVQRSYATSDEIQAALSCAKSAQRAWQSTPLATRAALVTSAVYEFSVRAKNARTAEKCSVVRELVKPMMIKRGSMCALSRRVSG